MNKTEIGQLLALASGFDRRIVDRLTTEAWASVPEFANASYEAAKAAVIAHQTGPKHGEYLTIGHITDALKVTGRDSVAAIEADVRSAKARGLIARSWPSRERLPGDVRETLTALRDGERRAAQERAALDELEGSPIEPGDIGRTVS